MASKKEEVNPGLEEDLADTEEENDSEIDDSEEEDRNDSENEEDMDEDAPFEPELDAEGNEIEPKEREMEGLGMKRKGVGVERGEIDDFSEKDYETEEDSEEEEEYDNTHLQKFQENMNMSFLEKMHPETRSINYDEMVALARVVRDKNGKIIDPLHKTMPFLTKYERARIIGARAEQIDHGGEPFIPLEESIINGRTIALMEFEARKIPFILARPLPNGSTEYWHLHDLEVLD
jgi:DNA-directed RNA polymerase I, II, and III subunit RPABC2